MAAIRLGICGVPSLEIVTLDTRVSLALHNAVAAAQKLRRKNYLDAYFEVQAKRRRESIPAPPAQSSSASSRTSRTDPIDIDTESEHEVLGRP